MSCTAMLQVLRYTVQLRLESKPAIFGFDRADDPWNMVNKEQLTWWIEKDSAEMMTMSNQLRTLYAEGGWQ